MRLQRFTLWGKAIFVALYVTWLATGAVAAEAPAASPSPFRSPLGYRDGVAYGPRLVRAPDGTILENTGYGVTNPDLAGWTCFGVRWDLAYHSGVDLYRRDGASAAGAEVTAIGDGVVVYARVGLNYPGAVVIVEHVLASGEKLYSMYAHLDDGSVAVQPGDLVTQGQRLGAVLRQGYVGRHPFLHPDGDDSHLHFELRRFFSARYAYAQAPACNGLIAGRGYTYPARPDAFPGQGGGYLRPDDYIQW